MVRRGVMLGAGIALVLVAAGAALRVHGVKKGTTPAAFGYSNIRPGDYVGPAKCGECHGERFAHWRASTHRIMNQRAGPGAIKGNFSGIRVTYGGGAAVFSSNGSQYLMSFERGGKLERRFRITRTIGARYLQEYVGVQIEGPEPASDPLYRTEIRLPFGYWLRPERWLHRQYFDSWYRKEYRADGTLTVDPFRPDREPWDSRCAWCHNTYPFDLRAERPRLGKGTEKHVRLLRSRLPQEERARVVEQNRLPTNELITVGISCESCHLGGREHALNDEEISFLPRSPDLVRRNGAPDLSGGRSNSALINAICAQCHSTPSPRYPDGGAMRNSSEALDLASGACASRIKCTDCHDPHRRGPGAGAPDQARVLAACIRCHSYLADARAARVHAGHEPKDASCLDCHMPRLVQGVSQFVRRHRISKPMSAAMIGAGAPNACNLCHLERSLGWALSRLRAGWGRRMSAGSNVILDRPMGKVWLASAEPGYRIAAAAAYARSPEARAQLPALVDILDDPIAYYRMFTLFAIEDIVGRRLEHHEYDPAAPPAVRARQQRALRATEFP